MPAADPYRDAARPGRTADPDAGAHDLGQLRGILHGAAPAAEACLGGRPRERPSPAGSPARRPRPPRADATVVPIVTGHVDRPPWTASPTRSSPSPEPAGLARVPPAPGAYRRSVPRPETGCAGRCPAWPPTPCPAHRGLAARLRAALHGPHSPPSACRWTSAPPPRPSPSHLRRAVTTRHPHCAFPGCDQPASACDIHHLIPRSRGGPTALPNLVPLVQLPPPDRDPPWGWQLQLNSDGTTTATSPDRTRTLHSHSPPPSQAA